MPRGQGANIAHFVSFEISIFQKVMPSNLTRVMAAQGLKHSRQHIDGLNQVRAVILLFHIYDRISGRKTLISLKVYIHSVFNYIQ